MKLSSGDYAVLAVLTTAVILNVAATRAALFDGGSTDNFMIPSSEEDRMFAASGSGE